MCLSYIAIDTKATLMSATEIPKDACLQERIHDIENSETIGKCKNSG